jgi:hypothetical protein
MTPNVAQRTLCGGMSDVRRRWAPVAGHGGAPPASGGGIIRAVPRSVVPLPREVRSPFAVYLNGVRQEPGADFQVRAGALVFPRALRKDKVSGRRWLLGAWGVGTYRQDDSVDVSWTRADGTPAVAERLEITHVEEDP